MEEEKRERGGRGKTPQSARWADSSPGRGAETLRRDGEAVHISQREAELLETIRGAEDPAGVMDAVLEALFALLPPS